MLHERLAGALIADLRSGVLADGAGWIFMEGVEVQLAKALARLWPEHFPPLVVAAPPDEDFGERALGDRTATGVRNESDAGLFLILCEGVRIQDFQSVSQFFRVSPQDLLRSGAGLDRLVQHPPSLAGTEAAAALREALLSPHLEVQPPAKVVARYLHAVANGDAPGRAVPLLGGFRDEAAAPSGARLIENLNLAALTKSPDLQQPKALADIRLRAEQTLAGTAGEAAEASQRASEVVEALVGGGLRLLELLSLDEAREILAEPPPAELAVEVARELTAYGRTEPSALDYLPLADDLAAPAPEDRKDAARELLDYDQAEGRAVFRQRTRGRLRALLRDRRVAASPDPCESLVRAVEQLGSALTSIELREPALPSGDPEDEAEAKAVLAVAALRTHAAPLLAKLEEEGVRLDGGLAAELPEPLESALALLDLDAGALRPVTVALRGEVRSDSVEFTWRPSPEDAAFLVHATVLAGGAPALATSSRHPVRLDAARTMALTAEACPPAAQALAGQLRETSRRVLQRGLDPSPLEQWAEEWRAAVAAAEGSRDLALLDALAAAGGIRDPEGRLALTHLSPLKAEWAAARTAGWVELLGRALSPDVAAQAEGDDYDPPIATAARGLAATTAANYPAFVWLSGMIRPLLPVADGKIMSVFAPEGATAPGVPPSAAFEEALRKLLDLHPEARGHLRCAAWGPEASNLAARTILKLLDSRRSGPKRAELFCVGGEPGEEVLADADAFSRGENAGRFAVRYLADLDQAVGALKVAGSDAPGAHLAVAAGVTAEGHLLAVDPVEAPEPPRDDDVLFTPRTWARPDKDRRVLLAPPTVSERGSAWLRLATAIADSWPAPGADLTVPEVRTDALGLRKELAQLHDLGLWVVTIDRYAGRDTLEAALEGDVAILHQERRASGSSAQGLVISQRSGGAADQAIARSLKRSRLATEANAGPIAEGLRRAASRGHGILALRAATTATGINELIGHVAGFARLGTQSTPWPLPPGCRILLISLDEYSGWFGRRQRADLLALALSPAEGGVHAAMLEVKAMKTAGTGTREAMNKAKEQLRQSLIDARYAARPNRSIYSRLWLNRIAEAAIGVARENRFRLGADDLKALDEFRRGTGVLDFGGIGMVFSPQIADAPIHVHVPLMGDLVPIALKSVALDGELLEEAARTDSTMLRTVETGRPALAPSPKTRRAPPPREEPGEEEGDGDGRGGLPVGEPDAGPR
ncbi:MAG: hypothetical protein ACRDPC_16075, partial [Solirubrobacteraceae bacterium]